MLEIIFLVFLVRKNRENAILSRKNPLIISILTVALYFIFFGIGLAIGASSDVSTLGIYALAILLGLIGAFISYIIAK